MDKTTANNKLSPGKLLFFLMWGIIILLILPMYLRVIWVDPVDYDNGGIGAGDFKAYYIAARLLSRNENIYDISLQRQESINLGYLPDDTFYIYPSLLASTLTSLARLNIEKAAILWNSLNFLLYIICLVLITATFNLRQILGNLFPIFVVLFFLAVPIFFALRIGQANIATFFLVTLAFFENKQKNYRIVGIALALATILKLFPAVLIGWFLWKKQKTVVIWFCATLGVLFSLNALFLFFTKNNPALDFYYFRYVFPNLKPPIAADNHSLSGFIQRVSLPAPWSATVTAVSGIALILATLWSIAKAVRQGFDNIGLALILTTTLLLIGITWTSTLIFLTLPVALLFSIAGQNKSVSRPIIGAVITSYILLNSTRFILTAYPITAYPDLVESLSFFGMLLIWGTLVFVNYHLSVATPQSNQPVNA
ncbi:MAG TPA: DUF2029 domain-containing protein [Anaerolineae bacterium]|nr:DUF2029 domain-containing protein [Anaerolineae bacterium]